MYSKTAALQFIRNDIKKIGYNDKNLVENYSISIRGDIVLNLDLVAFGDENSFDTTTSCISVKWIDKNSDRDFYLEKVKYIATPVMLLADKKNIEVIKVKKTQGEKILTLQYSELYPYFQKNRFNFLAANIIEAKYGFRQLSLFEAFDLFEFAEKANAETLGEEFKRGLFAGKEILDKFCMVSEDNYKTLTSITMHVLAAVILSHKLYPNKKVNDIDKLMDELSRNFKNYFDKEFIYSLRNETVDAIFNSLDKSITYSSVNNEMLGHFYESTLIGEDDLKKEEVRKEFGIYYTPKTLGNDILNHIPIEYINVDNRFILDGTCGSGSLLVSAYKRLEKMLPFRWDSKEKHDYLTKMINGIDNDRFAREVARLALLLYSRPHGNNWNIQPSDLLKITYLENMEYPMIIVANPPFKQEKKGEQKAIDFLLKYINFLEIDGYLGIILPITFLEEQSSKRTVEARRKLLETFDILEIWSLPGTIFANNCATCVIIAKKSEDLCSSENPIKIRIVNRRNSSIYGYLKNKEVDFEFFVKNKLEWLNNKNYVISFSPIECIVNKIRKHVPLGNLTHGTHGMDIPLDYPLISHDYVNGYSKYLHNAKLCFAPYFIDWENQKRYRYIKYDVANEEMKDLKIQFKSLRLRSDSRKIYENPKVIIKRSSTTGTFWCINAAIDREICYPGSAYYCLIPKDNLITLEELVAIINSKAANTFVRSLSTSDSLLISAVSK